MVSATRKKGESCSNRDSHSGLVVKYTYFFPLPISLTDTKIAFALSSYFAFTRYTSLKTRNKTICPIAHVQYAAIEMSLAIVYACVPALKPLVVQVFPAERQRQQRALNAFGYLRASHSFQKLGGKNDFFLGIE